MLPRCISLLTFFAAALLLLPFRTAFAVSCSTAAQMKPAEREMYIAAARQLAGQIQAGDVAGVKSATVASVAAQFSGIAGAIQDAAPKVKGATLTVNAIYGLDASDAKEVADEQFFCGSEGSPLLVTITIPQLPPGRYALVILHATGVNSPQQISMILSQEANAWKLAGLFVRPMMTAGHDGTWYWTEARRFAQQKQNWNAWFYYRTAQELLLPVNFLSSPNLERLQKEAQAVMPQGLPGNEPMTLNANGQAFAVTDMHTDGTLGGLDLVFSYKTTSVSDPAAARAQIVSLMKALLAAHPELREGFHGLWAYANAPGQRPFAIELPMSEIQ